MPTFKQLIKRFNNTFLNYDASPVKYNVASGPSTYSRPYVSRARFSNERTIISSIYARIAIDVAGIDIRHVKLDDRGRFSENIDSKLNYCLSLEPNLDQGPSSFIQDIVGTLLDDGVAAIVPVDTTVDPDTGQIIDILTVRVGRIIEWYPKHIKVSLYNENKGSRQEIIIEKRAAAIVENPFYSVMNEPNSTLQRLIRKLNLLDIVDDKISSGKLDLIIQLPYVIKSEARRQQAEARRKDIELQLTGSQHGIAYTDGTEKVTQLNRPIENQLLKQVEYLTNQLYSQLSITESVMNGTADEKTMINYYNRTVEPLLNAIVEAMQRSFLRVNSEVPNDERIKYFRDPFKLVPLSQIADIADRFSRNEILSANEIRSFMGIPPANDPKADMLLNSNMPQPGLFDPNNPGASAYDPNANPDMIPPLITDPNNVPQ